MSAPARPRAAILGGGVIGGGWAARFALGGWDVALHDPAPAARERVAEVLAAGREALAALSDVPMPAEGDVSFTGTLEEAVRGADWVQECVPERLELKHEVIAAIQQIAPQVPLGSSTSGFRPSQLQQGAVNPAAIFVAHPFNPVYLLPLVELVPSPATDPAVIEKARTVLSGLGMSPLHVRREIDAHIADRLLESVWREALWLVRDGVATTKEIDAAITLGMGPRWAQMGLFETYRIAGGDAGMRHFLEQFGPALHWPWSRLTDVPELDAELSARIAAQSDAQSGHHSIRELERIRDANLVGILRALKDRDWGAGRGLNAHDAQRREAMAPPEPKGTADVSEAPMELARMQVPASWIDYNGHMTESRYLHAASLTVDAFLALIGAGRDYVAGGFSYYSVESHIRHLAEAHQGDRLRGTVQLLAHDDKRLHLFVRIARDGEVLATVEQMLLHVDAARGRACKTAPHIRERVEEISRAHAGLPAPQGAGRAVSPVIR